MKTHYQVTKDHGSLHKGDVVYQAGEEFHVRRQETGGIQRLPGFKLAENMGNLHKMESMNEVTDSRSSQNLND